MNPSTIEYNGDKYYIKYDFSYDIITYVWVSNQAGDIVAESRWGDTEIAEGDIFELMEDNGFTPDVPEDREDFFTEINPNAEVERKLDEIIKLLKKIEKNTRGSK